MTSRALGVFFGLGGFTVLVAYAYYKTYQVFGIEGLVVLFGLSMIMFGSLLTPGSKKED